MPVDAVVTNHALVAPAPSLNDATLPSANRATFFQAQAAGRPQSPTENRPTDIVTGFREIERRANAPAGEFPLQSPNIGSLQEGFKKLALLTSQKDVLLFDPAKRAIARDLLVEMQGQVMADLRTGRISEEAALANVRAFISLDRTLEKLNVDKFSEKIVRIGREARKVGDVTDDMKTLLSYFSVQEQQLTARLSNALANLEQALSGRSEGDIPAKPGATTRVEKTLQVDELIYRAAKTQYSNSVAGVRIDLSDMPWRPESKLGAVAIQQHFRDLVQKIPNLDDRITFMRGVVDHLKEEENKIELAKAAADTQGRPAGRVRR